MKLVLMAVEEGVSDADILKGGRSYTYRRELRSGTYLEVKAAVPLGIFTNALADGIVTARELARAERELTLRTRNAGRKRSRRAQ